MWASACTTVPVVLIVGRLIRAFSARSGRGPDPGTAFENEKTAASRRISARRRPHHEDYSYLEATAPRRPGSARCRGDPVVGHLPLEDRHHVIAAGAVAEV